MSLPLNARKSSKIRDGMAPKTKPASDEEAPKRFRVRRVVGSAEADLEGALEAAIADGYAPSDHLAAPVIVLPNGDLLLVFELTGKGGD